MIPPIKIVQPPRRPANRLYSAWFGDGHWARMAHALKASAEFHCIGWDVEVERIYSTARGKYDTNVQKLEYWERFVHRCADGDQVVLIDSDCFVARPLDSVWLLVAEVGIAFKGTPRLPFNAGVVFLRVSEATRRFMAEWYAINVRMMGDRAFHLRYERTYSGINQAALGYMLERDGGPGVDVARLNAGEWNACNPTFWTRTDARIYHVKSQLRQQAQGGLTSGPYAHALKLWHSYAKGDRS